jgi:CubicO group peptidase (beta-lactamase class C family)
VLNKRRISATTIRLLLMLGIAALFAECGMASPSNELSNTLTVDAPADDPFAAALQEHMPALLATNHVPGAVISHIKNGEVIWTKAFGVANLQTGAPMRPDMVFNHGSDGKVLTAWGIMRLVEEGKVNLDSPANHYLKRWQIHSIKFDPNEVTIRRLLSHTAGLTVHGFSDYPPGAHLPSLVEVLEGKNQDNGAVFIKWQPGSTNVYSGGGFVILQMVIEDVSGESFAEFIQREVAKPLGLSSLAWVWTPELQRRAPMPYDAQQKEVGYRQLACQAIGSEICTVSDFAHFLAVAVPGSHGEPIGRGVLKPETIAAMTEVQPNALDCGLAYGVGFYKGEKFLTHSGANPGWNALFALDVNRRDGYVVVNNSSLGSTLNLSVGKLWGEIIGKEMKSDRR